jgi:hypothetical protein
MRADEVVVRHDELRADHQGLKAADEEEADGEAAVQHADLLVVDGGQPRDEPGLGRGALEDRHGLGRVGRLVADEIRFSQCVCHK